MLGVSLPQVRYLVSFNAGGGGSFVATHIAFGLCKIAMHNAPIKMAAVD
jgi:hypothetical protein